jgi:hypothetical protein
VNSRLKQLMKELGDAINESLSESERIEESIAQIKGDGYDVFLVLEATIGLNKREDEDDAGEEKPALVNGREGDTEPNFSAQDLEFLQSLRIRLDGAA